ncbi:hypothetical protein PQ469_26930 [Mucilaginibacter sp. KACC 22773]|uniref:hypothetical protein n=1 Tax=Mucilaginibacter sp. KACC 22773 TaxID=3025671 RepID=UPI00236692B2|nr:hypothetical protein [Mucilaginibacter sp. KACC 22773]WDF77525.1 hypothetical protein PQ469_26930 [Mucilaginibacter sp. KACC 22773]
MKTEMLSTVLDPTTVGEFITESFYKELTEDFQKKFPSEIRSVSLSRLAVEAVLKEDNVSGIKFMNGLEDANDPSSRILVLIPANRTVTNSLPNSIINKNGFMTNTGERISLERTWQVLFNHVMNFKKLEPTAHYTKINRGSFMGQVRLNEFLNTTDCSTFIYHFGYLKGEDLPYKLIIQPSDGMNMYIEMSAPCPGSTGCPASTSSEPCALTRIATNFAGKEADNQLNVLRGFRDKILQEKFNGAEIEKYYTISASLLEAIDKEQNKAVIFKEIYDKYIQTSITSINNNDEATAYSLFQEAMQHLTDTYLYQ